MDRVLGREAATPEGLTEAQFDDAIKLAERAPNVHTWRQLFLLCKEHETERLQRFGKRSREQTEEQQAAKRRIQDADEQLNTLTQSRLTASSSSSATQSGAGTSSSSSVQPAAKPASVRVKYMREMGQDRSKDAGKRIKLLGAARPTPPHLKSTSSHRVTKTSTGAIMKIPRAFDPARRSR